MGSTEIGPLFGVNPKSCPLFKGRPIICTVLEHVTTDLEGYMWRGGSAQPAQCDGVTGGRSWGWKTERTDHPMHGPFHGSEELCAPSVTTCSILSQLSISACAPNCGHRASFVDMLTIALTLSRIYHTFDLEAVVAGAFQLVDTHVMPDVGGAAAALQEYQRNTPPS
jgi:hypothetical protein